MKSKMKYIDRFLGGFDGLSEPIKNNKITDREKVFWLVSLFSYPVIFIIWFPIYIILLNGDSFESLKLIAKNIYIFDFGLADIFLEGHLEDDPKNAWYVYIFRKFNAIAFYFSVLLSLIMMVFVYGSGGNVSYKSEYKRLYVLLWLLFFTIYFVGQVRGGQDIYIYVPVQFLFFYFGVFLFSKFFIKIIIFLFDKNDK